MCFKFLFNFFCCCFQKMTSNELHIEEITNETLRCVLGEGPHYDIGSKNLYYVDIAAAAIFRYNLETKKIFKATIKDNDSQLLGFITPIEGTTDKFIVGAGRNLTVIRWDGESEYAQVEKVLVAVDSEFPLNRINDAKCDPFGRLFFGTMGDENSDLKNHPTGSLFRYENGSAINLRTSVGISNGLAWNEKLGKFYYIDSVTRNVKEYDYDSSNGNICKYGCFLLYSIK